MCDYSLQNVKTRPAKIGDKLFSRRFSSGTGGFSAPERIRAQSRNHRTRNDRADSGTVMTRRQLSSLFASVSISSVTARAQGHEVRLMSPEYVRPYVKSQKNDDRDAEAIAEAATRPTMRFVALKSEEQLDMQTLHRARDRLVGERTALINQLRAVLLERGITVAQGRLALASTLLPTRLTILLEPISKLPTAVDPL
jgi:hypothetical protein